MKRILAFLLCFCLCVSLIPAAFAEDEDEIIILDEEYFPAEDDDEELIDIVEPTVRRPRDDTQSELKAYGFCGRIDEMDLSWKLYDDGLLRIIGDGDMKDYHWFEEAPWKAYDNVDGFRITSVSVEDGVTSIGRDAFRDLDALTYAFISYTVSEIGVGAFTGCDSLSAFDVDQDSETFCTIDGVLFSADEETLVLFPAGKLNIGQTSYSVPYGTVNIAPAAFYGNKYLSKITLPSTLETVGESAFESCTWLCELRLPDSVTKIPRYMCKDCTRLWDASFYSVTDIAYGAFENCLGLHRVFLPYDLQSIRCCAFKGSGLDYIEIPNSVYELENQVFMECPWLETVVIGRNVSNIRGNLFDGCEWLERVIFTGDAPEIQQYKAGTSGSPDEGAFLNASFLALYPAEKSGWSSAITKDYGGDVVWEPYTDGLFIKIQPVSGLVYEGMTQEFSLQIGCVGTAVYQWQYRTPDETDWSDARPEWNAEGAMLKFVPGVELDGSQFRCVITSGSTTIYSDIVDLTVRPGTGTPFIILQPQPVNDYVGNTAVFHVAAGGDPELKYEWQYSPGTDSWKKCSSAGADTPDFAVPILGYRDGYRYRCRVTNAVGFIYSSHVTLTALGKVVITEQPISVSVKEDTTAKFTVGASGIDLSYQWQVASASNGYIWTNSTLSTAQTASLSVKGYNYRDGNRYRCKVSNVGGAVYSEPAVLTVLYKPIITAQPQSVKIAVGDLAIFRVEASGSGLSYQWQYRTSATGSWNNSSGSDAKTATLKVIGQSYRSGYQYRCIVKNSAGSTYSSAATLTVSKYLKPTITTQPKSVSKTAGGTASFSVTATGGSLNYQWQFKKPGESTWSNCSGEGATSATLDVEAKLYRSGYQYRCVVTNPAGSTTSNAATLTVNSIAKPTITTHPKSVTVMVGQTATFKVVASNAVSYQWQFRAKSSDPWSNCTNGTGATLNVEGKAYRNGYQYRCAVTNSGGTTYSGAATLTVTALSKPTITKQPVSAAVTIGQSANFTVAATGTGTLSYQWQFRASASEAWSNCTNGTGANLEVVGKAYRNGYEYRCAVTNAGGTTYSNAATLTVLGG